MFLVDGVFTRDLRAAEKSIMQMGCQTSEKASVLSMKIHGWKMIDKVKWVRRLNRKSALARTTAGRKERIARKEEDWCHDRIERQKRKQEREGNQNITEQIRGGGNKEQRVGDVPYEMKDHNEDDMQPMG
jgi:hypothetical protein